MAKSYQDLVQGICKVYQIDPKWMKAMIQVESAWNPYVVRYESNYGYLYKPQDFLKSLISLNTEIACQKMSWGLGQIMGAVAREQGFKGNMPELVQAELNMKHMCIRLAELKKKSQDPDAIFAGYNGGPAAMKKNNGMFINQRYVDKVNTELAKLG
jgi:soluble lytic murein transglycosylase-like protein